MIIRGYFIGDAPYFPVHLRYEEFEGTVWLLADTGASRTTLLDRDAGLLGLPSEALALAPLPPAKSVDSEPIQKPIFC